MLVILISLATIGVCVFCAVTSVAALFIFGGILVKFSELRKLSIEDVDLILKDQQELYSQEELSELREYREYLLEQKQMRIEEEKRARRLKTIICPKCDGLNDAINTKCKYCDYQFKESDYYSKEKPDQGESGESADPINAPIGRLLLGLLFSCGGIGSIIYGNNMNNSVEAQWDSFWNNGSTDPGTTWIIIGAAAVVVGIIMLMSAFLSNE